MKIGELARASGITAQAVRFYEQAGLLHRPRRTASGYRMYDASDLKRLRFIGKAKQLGFSLSEIADILNMHDAGQVPCQHVIAIAQRHLRATEQEIRRLTRFRAELSQALRQWKKMPLHSVAGEAICELIERAIDDNRWHDAALKTASRNRNGRNG